MTKPLKTIILGMWWLNQGDRKWPDLSENIFYGAGFEKLCCLVPDQQLVVASD